MQEQMNQQVQKYAVARLTEQGWRSNRLLTHVLTKEYATEVGFKSATARIDESKPRNGYWLSGEYWSEGNDALSCCGRLLQSSMDKETVIEMVDAFLVDIEKAISKTYAARLLHKFGPSMRDVKADPGKQLPANFKQAVAMLKRPYIAITTEQYTQIAELASNADTDVVLYHGRQMTFGEADGGYALMPLAVAI